MPLTILQVAYPFSPVGDAAVGGAEQVLATLDRPGRERGGPSRGDRSASSARDDADATDPGARAERTIETTLRRAKTEKTWTVAHGKLAERMFPRLSPEAATKLSEQILAAVESGDLKVEDKAWLPEKK